MKKRRRPPRPSPRQRAPFRLGSLVGRVIMWLLVVSVGWVVLYKVVPPPLTATMASDLIAGNGVTKQWLPLSRIDPNMARAAIAAEDAKFCAHHGFDTDAIADAAKANARGARIRGGSTISQQTAKNVFLWQGGGYFRKALEAWFTLLIEQIWGKRRIMETYLNVAETGIGTYGVEAGSVRYFRHGAAHMTSVEAARLAAVLPLPKRRAGAGPVGYTRRYGNSVAARMAVVRRDRLDACLAEK